MADLSNSHSACQSDLARKRSLETSDNDAQEGSKRRGHHSALDLLLHDRAMKINKDRFQYLVIDRIDVYISHHESHRRGCIGDKTPRVVEKLSEPLTTRRRRGPNVDSLFRNNSWTLKDTPDKENVPIVQASRFVLSDITNNSSRHKGRGIIVDKLYSQTPVSNVSSVIDSNGTKVNMQGIMFDHIQNLDKSRSDWRIKVRCTRTWPTVVIETNVLRGYNFIFLDDDNSHIHAYVYPDNWTTIGKEVVEGKVYVVQNFQVRDALGRLRPVANKLCIRLLSTTVIEEHPNDVMIPLHKFELMDVGDLVEESKKTKNDENPELAIDLIGVIENFKGKQKIPTRVGERDVVRFKISDGHIYHNVTFWGDSAVVVDKDYLPDLEKPVIAILTSTKIEIFKRAVQVGTLPSTKVYFNLDIEPVSEFRIRLKEIGYKPGVSIPSNGATDEAPLLEFSTFASLIENPEAFSSRKFVLATFTITKVEEEDNWWFLSCSSCHEEVTKEKEVVDII
ncbi:hypothetical protein ACET3Z_010821 [Daucus carota]